jgi:S-adenosyl-L-methionine hydrolase (adenosine-forming)
MPKINPCVVLLTDFGLSDHFVATMKGVMLAISPNLQIVDLTHSVEAQNIQQASYLLWASYRYFPARTVFTCVVDPGVGTSREIVVATTRHHVFLAPQNGLLDYVLWSERVRDVTVVQVDSPRVRSILPASISTTFHGRDIFAPLAAHLAKGIGLKDLGKSRSVDWIKPPFVGESNPLVKASILTIDHFGNIITNISGVEHGRPPGVRGVKLGSVKVEHWIENYESAPLKVPCLVIGSSGLIEIVMKNQSAAAALKANQCTPVGVLRS